MKRAAAASVLLSSLLAGCGPAEVEPQDDRLRVVVSVAPLAAIVDAVGSSQAEVEVVLPDGANPESWAATPASMVAVATADLVLLVGHPEISFEHRLAAQAEEAGVPMVRVADARPNAESNAVDGDPHLWLDLDLMRGTAQAVAGALGGLRPEEAANFLSAADTFDRQVGALDSRMRDLFSGRRLDMLVVQHPSWARLVARYGVEEVALEVDGKEATPARLIELMELVRDLRPGALIAQRGLSDRGVRRIAGETGVRIETLDPLSRQWLEALEASAASLAAALR
jgi:zinc transport system substrate-binding protein